MGTYAALAERVLRLPHRALFSTELLRDYFRRHGLGVFAGAEREALGRLPERDHAGRAAAAGELARRRPRRLLFYARPEPHAARNMYELGVLALGRAIERGAFADGWELHGIGTVERGPARSTWAAAPTLELLPRAGPGRLRARCCAEHDVGLALMYTPHPSLVPIEMASAGMLAVTNTFENKTARRWRRSHRT